MREERGTKKERIVSSPATNSSRDQSHQRCDARQTSEPPSRLRRFADQQQGIQDAKRAGVYNRPSTEPSLRNERAMVSF